jgi:hypothetical protein
MEVFILIIGKASPIERLATTLPLACLTSPLPNFSQFSFEIMSLFLFDTQLRLRFVLVTFSFVAAVFCGFVCCDRRRRISEEY